MALVGSVAAALIAGFGFIALGTHTRAATPSAATARTARAFVAASFGERATPGGRSEWVEQVPDDTGLLHTPSSTWNHRVFVDGLVRGNGGDVIRVTCGRHWVRVGSAGRVQSVDVPCGGSIAVDR